MRHSIKGRTIVHTIPSAAMDSICEARARKGPAVDVKWNGHKLELVYPNETAPAKAEAA